MTVVTTIVGNVGKDAVYKEGQNGKGYVNFSVGASTGWGDKKETLWFDVTKWNASPKLAEMLLKGSKVTVIGDQSEREHNGKTYKQLTAQVIDVQGRSGGDNGSPETRLPKEDASDSHGFGGGYADDLDSDIPF